MSSGDRRQESEEASHRGRAIGSIRRPCCDVSSNPVPRQFWRRAKPWQFKILELAVTNTGFFLTGS
jgi:hypothetical protein